MKTHTTLRIFHLLACLLWSCPLFPQVIYVKADAQGANNGTSWQSAYIDLQHALDVSTDDDVIWVAAGSYYPGSASPNVNSVFGVYNNISMYGGFVGTETSLEDRDPLTYLSVLSGDLNEDDIVDDFSVNKSENTRHVVYVDSLVNRVVIDGFTIKGGNTIDNANASIYDRSGGGIHAVGPVTITQCHFTGNFGRAGGGLYLGMNASSSIVAQCSFSHNRTTSRGAGLFGLSVSDISVSNCQFNENIAVRGSLTFITCTQIDINSCVFERNNNPTPNTASAGVGSFYNLEFSIRNSSFLSNTAAGGAAVFCAGETIPTGISTHLLIENCHFEGNQCIEWGGAIECKSNPDIQILSCDFISNTGGNGGAVAIKQGTASWTDTANVLIDSCLFISNVSTDFGGGALRLDSASSRVTRCVFDGNVANKGGHVFQNCPGEKNLFRNSVFVNGKCTEWGGAATAYGSAASYSFENCRFENNESEDVGGAVQHAVGSETTYKNCSFRSNQAEQGGALALNLDSTRVSISDSEFNTNVATFRGGAIFTGNGNCSIEIVRSIFDGNIAGTYGGAIFMNESGNDGEAELHIENSLLGLNVASAEGAAVYVEDGNTTIVNSVLFSNLCNGSERSGAIVISTQDLDTTETNLINCTLAGEEPFETKGLILTTDSLDALNRTRLQNCIFDNHGAQNYSSFGPNNNILSNGGNMSNDDSMIPILLLVTDLNMTNPEFTDPTYPAYDFSIPSGSPGIDAGVTPCPEFDILGNPRVNAPDMGAYENQNPVGIKEILPPDQEALFLFPNPVKDQDPVGLLRDPSRDEVNIKVFDLQGNLVYTRTVQKTDDLFRFSIPEERLGSGQYQVVVSIGPKKYVGQVVLLD